MTSHQQWALSSVLAFPQGKARPHMLVVCGKFQKPLPLKALSEAISRARAGWHGRCTHMCGFLHLFSKCSQWEASSWISAVASLLHMLFSLSVSPDSLLMPQYPALCAQSSPDLAWNGPQPNLGHPSFWNAFPNEHFSKCFSFSP